MIDDENVEVKSPVEIDVLNYEELITNGDPDYKINSIKDEWQALSLNYTSGTTGKPKGVVYHHRGSYLMSMGTVAGWSVQIGRAHV